MFCVMQVVVVVGGWCRRREKSCFGPISDLDPHLGPFWPFFRVAFRLARHHAELGVLFSNQSTGAILEFAFAPKLCFCFYELLWF
jgi:hypothetical protein